MAVLVADSAAYVDRAFGLEGTSPSPVSILLAILAVIFIYALNLHIVAIQQFLQLLILLPIEYLLHLLHPLLQLIIIIRNNDNMQWLVVLKNILLRLVGAPAPHCNLAAGPLLYQLLGLSARADDLADVVGLGIADCVLGEVDLLELLEGTVILRRHEGLPHPHAVLDQRNALPDEIVTLPHLSSVDTLALVIVDGLGTGRPQVWVIRAVIAHL